MHQQEPLLKNDYNKYDMVNIDDENCVENQNVFSYKSIHSYKSIYKFSNKLHKLDIQKIYGGKFF